MGGVSTPEEGTMKRPITLAPFVAVLLRQHLQTARVARTELFTSDAHRKHITFHDLRATGITWCAVRGDDPLRIKQRAGHKAFSTTEVYIREAENLHAGFGAVFPPLPGGLFGRSLGQPLGQVAHLHAKIPANMVEQRGIEPGQVIEITTIPVDSRTDDLPRVYVSAREAVAFGPVAEGTDRSAPSPRVALVRALSDSVAAAFAVGDARAARVALDALRAFVEVGAED
jgi:hypothetical protein